MLSGLAILHFGMLAGLLNTLLIRGKRTKVKQKIKTILLLVLFAAFATWLYPTVVGYLATLYIPLASKLPRTRMIMGTWLSAGGASGAAICAFLLAWPLGYFTKEKPIFIGTAFGLITAGFPLIAFISTSMENGFNGFVTSIFAVEQVAFVAASIFIACGGSRVANKMTRQANT
jgi:hypothetical protein